MPLVPPRPRVLHPVEALEDALELFGGDAHPAVLYPDPYGVRCGRDHRDRDPDIAGRILDGVVEEVGDNGRQLLGVAADSWVAVGCLQRDRARIEVVPDEG